MSLERILRTLHGWLGVLVLPWIILAGLTGLFENHGDLFLRVLPQSLFTSDMVQSLPANPVDAAGVQALATRLQIEGAGGPAPAKILARPGFKVIGEAVSLEVDAATGAYWLEGPVQSTLYAADGQKIASRVRWAKLMIGWHRAGWLGNSLGTWPADITAAAMMVFGGSGIFLFFAPRLRRLRNRRARRDV